MFRCFVHRTMDSRTIKRVSMQRCMLSTSHALNLAALYGLKLKAQTDQIGSEFGVQMGSAL